MNTKGFVLALVVLMTVAMSPAMAQMNLSDMVAQGGYDWLIGKWVATTDDGAKIYFEHQWALDKNAVLVDFQAPDFKYAGMIAFIANREEIVQYGADNQGGTYKGLWRQEYDAAVLAMEHIEADGTVQKMELVYKPGQGKAIEVSIYDVESDGWRASQPKIGLAFEPRTTKIPISGSSSNYSYYQSLGDLATDMGFGWIAGKWTTTSNNGQTVTVEYKWTLDKYAVVVDAGIGQFKYHGLIMFVPYREEVIQIGADNMGGVWDGTWSESYEGLSHRTTCTRPDGTKIRVEHLYAPGGKDAFTLKEYRLDASGYRDNSAGNSSTFKRVSTGTAK